MSDFEAERLVVQHGTARTAIITGAVGDDEFAVMYSPAINTAQPERNFIKLKRKGEFVYLSETNNMVLLDLPGTYFFEPVKEVSEGAEIHVSDKPFPFALGGTF